MKCNAKGQIIKQTATEQTVYFMQVAFIEILGDKFGWRFDRICRGVNAMSELAKAFALGTTDIKEAVDDIYKRYKIRWDENGSIYADGVVHTLYGPEEWKPLAEQKPEQDGSYLITTDKGAVLTAHWYSKDNKFSGVAGAHAVAWIELPDPWEFFDEEETENAEKETV